MRCPACSYDNDAHEDYCAECGHDLEAKAVAEGDNTGGVIPYKNPRALGAYYLGLFSIFPLLGLFMGIAALVLGRGGLKAAKEEPVIKGTVHAYIGIGCGSVGVLLNAALIAIVIMGLVAKNQ
ncbi:MAG: hypothetical protein AAF581_12395 [Planctomycetota bacterium]